MRIATATLVDTLISFMSVREIDGSSAGGQFLRTALGLAVLENEPVRIENVRGDRSTPGLRHQHLAVLETMAELCDADVSGDELGSETIEFDPGLASAGRPGTGRLEGGSYAVDIGTAGSTTLLCNALLPLATILESPLSVTATGGTDVAWSPPLDYLRTVTLPLLRRFGLEATCEVDRRGFYPDGGGEVTLRLAPSRLERIDLDERGALQGLRLYSTESALLADRDVAHRQAEGALERLDGVPGLGVTERHETTVTSPSPGSAWSSESTTEPVSPASPPSASAGNQPSASAKRGGRRPPVPREGGTGRPTHGRPVARLSRARGRSDSRTRGDGARRDEV